MHFLRVSFMLYDTVNVIHDVITTANLIPYTAKLMFVGVKITKLSKSDVEK